MRQIIFDTSFIIACIRKKIDFFHDKEVIGLDLLIPEQVIKELKGLGESLALRVIKAHEFKLVKAPGKDADAAIIQIAKKNPQLVVATLDAGLKKKLKNKIMRIRGEKQLEIV
jgi:rRNA-processing protein FCF1